MMALVLRVVVNAVALFLAALIVPGVEFGGGGTEFVVTLVVVAAIFGLINAVLKPILTTIAFPLLVLTLGLFALVINALLFMLTGWLAEQLDLAFTVAGFWPALLGALVVSIVSVGLRFAVPD